MMGTDNKKPAAPDYDRPIDSSRQDRFTSHSADIVIHAAHPEASEQSHSAENPWLQLPDRAPFMLAIDANDLQDKRAAATSELLFDQFPVPFVGARDAPVVMLTLNPGGSSKPELYTDDYRDQRRKRLRFETRVPFMSLDPEFASMPGARYWRARLSQIIDRVGIDVVGKRLLCLQYFPYQSKTYRALPTTLPSQHYTFGLLREAIRRGRLIVILRSRKLWTAAVPALANARPIELRNPRSPYLTQKNMPVGDFERIIEALNQG